MPTQYCYECDPKRKGGYNHNKCTVRVGRKGAKCDCWCLDESSKYTNHFSNKEEMKIEV